MQTLQIESPPLYEQFAGYEWIGEFVSGWQFGEQGCLAEIVRRLGDCRVAVEVGGGDGEKLPLTIEPLLGSLTAIAYEMDKDNRCKLASKHGKELHVRGMFTGGECLANTQPDVLLIDVDGIDALYMESSLQHVHPQVIVVEHYDKCGPVVNDMPGASEAVPQWLLGMPVFNGFVIQAPSQHLDRIASRHGYQPIFRTRLNSFYASRKAAKELHSV